MLIRIKDEQTGKMIRPRKTYMIHLLVLICFITAYLPVTQSWQIKYRSATNLTDLVRSAALLFDQTGSNTAENTLAQSGINDLMTHLKFAAGIVKPVQEQEKSKIIITESMPEFPIVIKRASCSVYPVYLEPVFVQAFSYMSIFGLLDPPIPKSLAAAS